jgi:predicted permease
MASRLGSGASNNNSFTIDGRPAYTPAGELDTVRTNEVGPKFFATLRIPLLMGREFTDADNASSAPVAIVNQLLAERYFPHEDPIGHHIYGFIIIGVVANHKYRSMAEMPIPMAWWDYAQAPGEGEMTVAMRVEGADPLAILPSVRKIVAQMDPGAPLIQPMLLREQFETSISQQLLFARLAEAFGLLAVVLVATGLYGTLSWRVNRRAAEIGVRMAVGARRGQVIWMVLRESIALTAIGAALGLPLAAFVGRALSSSLYGVHPFDPLSYAFAAAGVALVALTAAGTPAIRAAGIDPLTALRTE